jgi:hypothetical protein
MGFFMRFLQSRLLNAFPRRAKSTRHESKEGINSMSVEVRLDHPLRMKRR